MKTRILSHLGIIAICTTLVLGSCKKNDANNNQTMTDAQLQTQSDDENRVSNESDAVFNDVNTSLTSSSTVAVSGEASQFRTGVITTGGGMKDTIKGLICDATIYVDTTVNPRTITIVYNGSNCQLTRTRTGTVVISVPAGMHWHDKGAVITVDVQNLKVTRVLDNKSITINGKHTYTNVSGGSLINLSNGTPIIHTVTSDNMSITFDNGSQRSWQIARQRTYSYSNGIVVSEVGFHSDGTNSDISEWGTNRFGNPFTVRISQPLTVKQSCAFQLTGGQASLINSAGTTTITFGLDAQGNASSCPVQGASYYFKLVFTGTGGRSYTFILPY